MKIKSVLEIDEIEGTFMIRIPDYIIEELEYWDEGDPVEIEVVSNHYGDHDLKVVRI